MSKSHATADHGDRQQASASFGAASREPEREADRVADAVTQGGFGLHAGCTCGGSCARCRAARERLSLRARRPATGDDPQGADRAVASVRQAPGRPLGGSTRRHFERRLGHDFSRVRVHTGPRAVESAESLQAEAFTVGSDIAFNANRYRPDSTAGRWLLAHELTHVVQQQGGPARVQRRDKPAKRAKKRKKSTPFIENLPPISKEEPCACLLVVHNNERVARRNAVALHQHCHYNLAMVQPDTGARDVIGGAVDPNQLFPPDTTKECLADKKGCEAKVAADPNTRENIERQFFLGVSECSKDFSLPVVALHNNSLGVLTDWDKERQKRTKEKEDAAIEAAKKAAKAAADKAAKAEPEDKADATATGGTPTSAAKPGWPTIDKTKWDEIAKQDAARKAELTAEADRKAAEAKRDELKESGDDKEALKDARKKVKEAKEKAEKARKDQKAAAKDAKKRTKSELIDEFQTKKGPKLSVPFGESTNIFKWCALPEIQKCHVGDPKNIDQVVWVTQSSDFDTLAKKDINVVLQWPDPSKARVGGDSATDLSTLFVDVESIRGKPARFVNIETAPKGSRVTKWSKQKKRVAEAGKTEKGFDFIKRVLEPLKLYCCDVGVDEIKKKGIREALGVKEAEPEKKDKAEPAAEPAKE